MNFIKEFIQKPDGEIVIKDKVKTDEFIGEKVRYFSDIYKFADKNEILCFYQEIIDMCEYDIRTAKIDTSVSDKLIGFDKKSIFEQIILLYNFSSILGAIYNKLFPLETHKLHLKTDGYNGPVSIPLLYQSAFEELASLYNANRPAYGATLIFVTLIEEKLKTSIKDTIIKDSLAKIDKKITDGVIKLDNLDNKLYDYLRGQYITNIKSAVCFEGIAASTKLSYELFIRHQVITSSNEIKKIFMNKMTLNQLILSQECKEKVDERYIKVLQILFQSNKLNLRNNLAHCGFSHINYYNYNISMLLYGVLNTLLCDMCFL